MKRLTEFQRFCAKIRLPIEPGGCWEWTAAKSRGYGYFKATRMGTAHRYSYRRFVGDVPDGLTLDHLCRNRSCVNPAHLEPVTDRVNILRGESPHAQNARKTHCPKGHEYTPENTTTKKTGSRLCRTCHRAESLRQWRQRQAARDRKKGNA